MFLLEGNEYDCYSTHSLPRIHVYTFTHEDDEWWH
jgi:hypothetical protein